MFDGRLETFVKVAECGSFTGAAEDLESKMAVNGYAVSYELSGTDDLGLYRYYMRTEQNGQKIYWEIHCFEESIEQFIGQVLN